MEHHEVPDLREEGLLLDGRDQEPMKAKARHVTKGFSETGAEDLDSTTPQVAKETAFFVPQVIASLRWTLGNLGLSSCRGSDPARTICRDPARGHPRGSQETTPRAEKDLLRPHGRPLCLVLPHLSNSPRAWI